MFWRVGHYKLEMFIEYDNSEKVYGFTFDVSEGCFKDIKHNIQECLMSYLKEEYRVPYNYKVIAVKVIN